MPRVIDCDDSDSFLDLLSPRGPVRRDAAPDVWMFRGQADAGWDLLPSAFRAEAVLRTADGWESLPVGATNRLQILAEFQTARAFFLLADHSGLPLPEDGQQMRALFHAPPEDGLIAGLRRGEHFWPPLPMLSLLALAQHYGVPTRLLDWSRSHLTAAYFAALEAARAVRGDGGAAGNRLGVYAVNWTRLAVGGVLDPRGLREPTVVTVTAPGAGNPNLYAQGGQFTHVLDPRAVRLDDPVDRSPQAEWIERQTPLLLATLPAAEAPRLLRLLAKEGTTAASLFPGFPGVRQAMDERRYWDREDGWL